MSRRSSRKRKPVKRHEEVEDFKEYDEWEDTDKTNKRNGGDIDDDEYSNNSGPSKEDDSVLHDNGDYNDDNDPGDHDRDDEVVVEEEADGEKEEEVIKKVASVTSNAKKTKKRERSVSTTTKKMTTPACSKEGLVPLSRPKKKKKKEFIIDEDEEAKPTYTRKTKRGGYAHTNLSRSRISKANSGNTPWNYGKQRSSADRAKIAAGVRARNRTILLEKLKQLGMTEEEWIQKKKEIKYLRERVRRAKRANQKVQAELHAIKLQEALDATDEKKIKNNNNNKKTTTKTETKASLLKRETATRTITQSKNPTCEEKEKECDDDEELKKKEEEKEKQFQEEVEEKQREIQELRKFQKEVEEKRRKFLEEEKQRKLEEEQQQRKLQEELTNKVFPEKIKFKPFSFSGSDGTDDNTYTEISFDRACNGNGTGGLICCEGCSRKYNEYLMRTLQDVETQRLKEEALEVTEISEFLNEKKDLLKSATDSVIATLPPSTLAKLRLLSDEENKITMAPRPKPRSAPTPKSAVTPKNDSIDSEDYDFDVGASWNLTSAFDIGSIGGFASI